MVRFGTVRFFDGREGKSFGFIDADDDRNGVGIFFHVDDHCACSGTDWLERQPRTGDRFAFRVSEDWSGRPKASPWTYESEYKPKLKLGEPLRLRLEHLPTIEHCELTEDDVVVGSLDVEGSWGRGPRTTWIDLILRSQTGELFQLPCWEGEFGGETTSDRAYRYVPELEVEIPDKRRTAPCHVDEAA